MSWDDRYPRQPTVAERRVRAKRHAAKLSGKRQPAQPVEISGRTIAKTFWGKAWCDNLERYSDYANRLPRGRSYVRHGSVVDLRVGSGRIDARVSGSRLYTVTIGIAPLSEERWAAIRDACAGGVGSLVELLKGELSNDVMQIVTREGSGLFPSPKEITLHCSCPDWASMCKHVGAALYGVGARLDSAPELLFTLRGVDPAELVHEAIDRGVSRRRGGAPILDAADAASVFGVDIDLGDDLPAPKPRTKRAAKRRPRATPKTEATSKRRPRATPKTEARSKREADPRDLNRRASQVLDLVRAQPGLRTPSLAEQLGVSRSTIANAVAELKRRQLVTFMGAPRNGGYYAAGASISS